jgi:hypothetical protein
MNQKSIIRPSRVVNDILIGDGSSGEAKSHSRGLFARFEDIVVPNSKDVEHLDDHFRVIRVVPLACRYCTASPRAGVAS